MRNSFTDPAIHGGCCGRSVRRRYHGFSLSTGESPAPMQAMLALETRKKFTRERKARFNHLVDVNFHNSVLSGKFDLVGPGQTMTRLEQNFAELDSKNGMEGGFYIWLFGNAKSRFENNKLYVIWCNYLSQIHLGKVIQFDKGILNNVTRSNITRVLNMLVSEGADLQIHHQSPYTLLIHASRSSVTLWLEADEEQPSDPQSHMLMAFGLTHCDYDTGSQYS